MKSFLTSTAPFPTELTEYAQMLLEGLPIEIQQEVIRAARTEYKRILEQTADSNFIFEVVVYAIHRTLNNKLDALAKMQNTR